MVQIFLVRHGQANSEAKDEVSYDKLSPLGKIQAGWLGQYFKKNEFNFDVCFSGTLLRQRDTANLLECHNRKEIIRDPGLNEIQYYTLSTLVEQQFKKLPPKTGLDFEQHFDIHFFTQIYDTATHSTKRANDDRIFRRMLAFF